MKKILILAFLMVSLLGCSSVVAVVDAVVDPEVISRLELGRLIAQHLGVGIVISIERGEYEIIPSRRFDVLLKEFYPKGSPLDAAAGLKTLAIKGAVGIALLGPSDDSRYWVVYLNEDKVLYLVDPVSKDVILWNWIQAEGAWVSF